MAQPAIRDLARRLIALEAARDPSDGPTGASARACVGLRDSLARLAGLAGFRSLLSRALALAKTEHPSLADAQLRDDGSLEGLGSDQPPGGGAAVVTHLLTLLVLFIGEPLTRQLVADAWPDAANYEPGKQVEGRS